MKPSSDTILLLNLLDDSRLFDEKAKGIIRRSIATTMLPEIDQTNLLYTLKMEKNAHAIIDQRAEKMIEDLKKKYQQT